MCFYQTNHHISKHYDTQAVFLYWPSDCKRYKANINSIGCVTLAIVTSSKAIYAKKSGILKINIIHIPYHNVREYFLSFCNFTTPLLKEDGDYDVLCIQA